jgi:RNA polymerase sigma-70 factor, ECF subfamily
MDRTEEEALILAAKARPERFAPLYELHFPAIFRFILKRASDRELTADLTQQTFLKAMLALPRYEPRGLPFKAYLYRIALNELHMHWRKRKEFVMDLSYAEVKGLSDELGILEQEAELALLARALGRLTPDKAQLIELRYMDGMSFAEMGAVLGVGEDAAKMRTHRVLNTLRTYLSPRA